MTNTYNHAKKELDLLFTGVPDSILAPVKDEILALCETFGNTSHPGGPASVAIPSIAQAIKILLSKGILTPLTGEADEWKKIEDGKDDLYQNKRHSAVFKKGIDGDAYYLDAIAWKDGKGNLYYTTAKLPDKGEITSEQYIKSFPFTPKTFYINVAKIKQPFLRNPEFRIKSKRDLKPVFEYYGKN